MKPLDKKTFDELEAKIRTGELAEVKQFLDDIKFTKIPRAFILRLANLARRVGYQRYAARLLHPIVRPQKPIHPPATAEEKIEYAVNIMRLGVAKEALTILAAIDAENYPDVKLYKAFCNFNTWDYALAVPLLESYLKSPKLSQYQLLVAKINLANAYLNSLEYEKAKLILSEITASDENQSNKLIIGNAHELLTEYYVNQGDVKNAKKHVAAAEKILSSIHYRYAVYNQKWQAIIKLMNPKTKAEGLHDLAKVRAQANTRKLYEVIRECDYYEAILTQNYDLLAHLYFGTPFESARRKFLNRLGPVNTDEYLWIPAQTQERNLPVFDCEMGVDLSSQQSLKGGGLVHKLMQILCSDFYRPFKVQALFSLLFPDENFNFLSSTRKVHDLIFRLRVWLEENKIPIIVASTGRGEFQIQTLKPYAIRVRARATAVGSIDLFIKELKHKIRAPDFSVFQAIEAAGVSRSKAKRLLKEAVNIKLLKIKGKGRGVRYAF